MQRAAALPRQAAVSRSVVLLTDGYIDSEPEVFDFVRDQLDRTNFFSFGIGPSVNRFLIEGVARAGLGEPFIVTEPGEAEQAAARLRRYIDSPVLSGIDVKFSRASTSTTWSPRAIPDLFASRPVVVFGKWRGSPGGSVEISGQTGRGPYQTSIPIVRGQRARSIAHCVISGRGRESRP